jgi:hypothetical protein
MVEGRIFMASEAGHCIARQEWEAIRKAFRLSEIALSWDARTEKALRCGMDLGEQAANAVAGLGNLSGEIVVKAAQHGELCERFIS